MAWVFVALGVGVAALLLVVSRRPDRFTVTRRAVVRATPEQVFAQIADLSAWGGWSPWADKDPNMTQAFSMPTHGVGAWASWEGDRRVGAGRMTILEAAQFQRVRLALDFEKPFRAKNEALFEITPAGDGAQVAWTMSGPAPFVHKFMGLFMNFDRVIGADFELGLARLKRLVEGG